MNTYRVRKFNIFLLCICMIMSLCACTSYAPQKSSKLSVVTVIFPQYDMARAVCSDLADVKMIMRPGAEVHGYEPSLSDIVAIEEADVFIYGGGESDVWIERILSSIDTSDMTVVSLMDCEGVKLYEDEHISKSHIHLDHAHDHSHEDEGELSYDEHIWTSPKNAINILNVIEDAIISADSKNKDGYEKNAEAYRFSLKKLDSELNDVCSESQGDLIVVADRFPLLYLAKDYGLQYMAAFSGCSPESDAGPSVIAEMTEEIKLHNIDSVFHIELSNEKMADAICEITGAKKLLIHSCQSVSREDFNSGKTYVDIMRENISNLEEALN